MKYKIFYSFKGGSDNSKNNSIENVEDTVSKINLEEGQNPTDKLVSTSQSISSNQPINEVQEIPLTEEQRKELKKQKEKERQRAKKNRQKEKKAKEEKAKEEKAKEEKAKEEKAKEENIPSNSTSTPSVSSTNSNPKKKSFARQKINERKDAPPNTTSSTSTSIKSNEFNLPFNPLTLFFNQKTLSKPDDLDADILIIGENHADNSDESKKLKEEFIEKGAFVFGEGFLTTSTSENLDNQDDNFRSTIFITSLYTKNYQLRRSDKKFVDELLSRQRDLLQKILRNKKIPTEELISIEKIISTWNDIRNKKRPLSEQLLKSLIPKVNDITFDFLKIYEYYFGNNDPYYNDMDILLKISDMEAFFLNISGPNHSRYGEHFKKIMMEARETKMVERVLAYMDRSDRRPKIVIFTGKMHVDNLHNELSKTKYTVKSRNLL